MTSLFRKRSQTLNVTEPLPTYSVNYLGNVPTVMAKGDGCADKALGVVWKNMQKRGLGNSMTVKVSPKGLQAETKQQGVTEYSSHRITYCIAPPQYPRVFCWIYRHEGKKMKVEQRAHAVLCASDAVAKCLVAQLQEATTSALREFVRDKCRRQNYRLLVKCKLGVDVTVCKRKALLSTAHNYKPPVARSRSAPRLHSIDESYLEEGLAEEEDEEEALHRTGTSPGELSIDSAIYEIEEEDDLEDVDEEEEEEEAATARERRARGANRWGIDDTSSIGDSIDTTSSTTSDDIVDDLLDDASVRFYIRQSSAPASTWSGDDGDSVISTESGYSECDSEPTGGARVMIICEQELRELELEASRRERSSSLVSCGSNDTLKGEQLVDDSPHACVIYL
ncbi:PREDICTED: protein FAM43A-like [Priapulus caudatus]|uniref:Protein FAM43A-like n=1 Tax=Priapulus caudatus TaxID=37621 RepID=A0ABM1F1L7_PRICU|nr:PREDICTED: protein FAM43A-like [Priapulus caudatus]